MTYTDRKAGLEAMIVHVHEHVQARLALEGVRDTMGKVLIGYDCVDLDHQDAHLLVRFEGLYFTDPVEGEERRQRYNGFALDAALPFTHVIWISDWLASRALATQALPSQSLGDQDFAARMRARRSMKHGA